MKFDFHFLIQIMDARLHPTPLIALEIALRVKNVVMGQEGLMFLSMIYQLMMGSIVKIWLM